MWLDPILTAALAPDNEPSADELPPGEAHDLRSLWPTLRLAVLLNGAASLALVSHAGWTPLAVTALCGAANEAQCHFASHISSRRRLQAILTGSSLLFSLSAALLLFASAPIGVMTFIVILAAYGPVLRSRSMLVLTGVAATSIGVRTAAGVAGLLGGAVHPADVLAGAATGVAVAAMLFLATRRLRAARLSIQALVTDLRTTQQRLAASHARLATWNEQLNDEVARQTAELASRGHRLTMINDVSGALNEAMTTNGAFDDALSLLGVRLGACAVNLYVTEANGGNATLQRIRLHDAHPEVEVSRSLLEDVAMEDRAQSAAQGSSIRTSVAGGYLVSVLPVLARGDTRGAIALVHEHEWPPEDLEALAVVARELGAAAEHRTEFRAAIGRANREAVLNTVARALDAPGDTRDAIEHALRHAGKWIGATEAVLVTRSQAHGQFQVTARSGVDRHGQPDSEARSAMDELLLSMAPLVADRSDALLIGPDGEIPLAPSMVGLGIGSLLVAPVSMHRAPAGALVITTDGAHRLGLAQQDVATRVAQQLSARLESDALIGLQARRIAELSGLARIAEVMQSAAEPGWLLRGFTRAMAELLPFEAMYTVMRQEGDGLDVTVYGANGHGRAIEASSEDAQHPWLSVRSGSLLTRIGEEAPHFYRPSTPPLIVPLRPKGEDLGVVLFVPSAPLQAEQVSLATQAVAQLAVALNSAALYQQATERAARIQVLGNLARIVASVVDLRDAFDAFAEEVRWLIPFDRALMCRVDAAAGTLIPYAAYPSEGFAPQVPKSLRDSPAWPAYEGREPVSVHREQVGGLGLDAVPGNAEEVAIVPVVRDDECIAMFALVRSGGEPYTQEALSALEEVARLLAISIERVELFQQAEYNARHDMLTGLANARYLQERIEGLDSALEAGRQLSTVMLDMDDLKILNDTLGHHAGDRAIELVARAVIAAVRTEDFVARVGGDEFVVLMQDAGREEAAALATRIAEALREAPVEIDGTVAPLRVSIGIASAPDDARSVGDLIHAADVAMYAAKFAGGAQMAFAGGSTGEDPGRLTRGRPERLVDSVVRAATAAAQPREREAILRAQRYALMTAVRMGVPVHESEVIRMLVARQAAERLGDSRAGLDHTLAAMVLDGLSSDWASRDAQSAALASVVVETAVSLAWLELAQPLGAGYDTSEALGRLSEVRRHPIEATVLQELIAAIRDRDGLGEERVA